LFFSRSPFTALLLDLVLVGIVKASVRRRRPVHNRMDMFATFSVDRYSFPSGHATRAAMCGRFLLAHLVLAAPLRVLVLLWAGTVGLSRVLLGRHNVTDVLFGFCFPSLNASHRSFGVLFVVSLLLSTFQSNLTLLPCIFI
jgi:membrane-associated phospholipid phosphatase